MSTHADRRRRIREWLRREHEAGRVIGATAEALAAACSVDLECEVTPIEIRQVWLGMRDRSVRLRGARLRRMERKP